jgi:hypothetical protein
VNFAQRYGVLGAAIRCFWETDNEPVRIHEGNLVNDPHYGKDYWTYFEHTEMWRFMLARQRHSSDLSRLGSGNPTTLKDWQDATASEGVELTHCGLNEYGTYKIRWEETPTTPEEWERIILRGCEDEAQHSWKDTPGRQREWLIGSLNDWLGHSKLSVRLL